jgi:hypothetical protein
MSKTEWYDVPVAMIITLLLALGVFLAMMQYAPILPILWLRWCSSWRWW